MTEANSTFFCENEINKKLISTNGYGALSLGHLRLHLEMKYRSFKEAGDKAGISEGRVRQILCNRHIPKKPELIYKIALGWGIDPVKLTQLFERIRENEEIKDEIV